MNEQDQMPSVMYVWIVICGEAQHT